MAEADRSGAFDAAAGSADGLVTASGERATDDAIDALMRQVAALDDGDAFESEPVLAGEAIAHFAVVRELGRGGMGVVYLADDLRLRRRVALKVLPAAAARDPERARRLLRDARAAAAVSHPNIAAVFDVGEVDGRIFIAMEHVDGESLRARLARGRLEVREVLDVAQAILAGLAAAHAAGLVHRDLKPDNMMIASDGGVRILDFGLAKRSATSDKTSRHDELTSLVTRAGHVLGTPAYMSPEQAVGDPVDHRSDLFSFGVLLYEMLVGRRPFAGTSQVALMTALLGADPEPPARARPEIGSALSAIVMRCLAKEPAARWPDAAAIARELTAARAGAPLRSRRAAIVAVFVASAVVGSLVVWATRSNTHGPVATNAGSALPTPLLPASATSSVMAARGGLGATGAACRVGAECVSGRCAADRCGPWSAPVEGEGSDSTNAVAVLSDGQIVITGWFKGTLDVGCGPLSALGSPDMTDAFVARFKREGTCLWSRRFGGTLKDVGNNIYPAADGHVVLEGEFQGTADFGGEPLTSRGSDDIVVLELDARGNHVWSKRFGGPGREIGGMVRDPAGNLVVFGSFTSPSLDLGGRTFTLQSPGYGDGFVVKLTATGDHVWSRAFASTSRKGTEAAFSAATDARGDIALHGAFYDALDFGGGALVSAGDADTFLVKLSGADGAQIWARRFGTAADEPYEGGVAFDDEGNLFAAGEHRGAELGGGTLPGSIYVAKYTASGEHVWSRGFGGESPRDCARRVAVAQDGNPVVFGRFLSASIDFDGRHFTNAGGSDPWVARFDATSGRVLGVETFFATDAPARALAIDPRTDNVVVGGRFEGSIDFGAGLHKAVDQDGYFASLGPPP